MSEVFEKALKMLRAALADIDLEVVGEIDTSSRAGGRRKTLLVACPLLMFEALALDRAAAVFVPLHVIVRADGERTEFSIIDPTKLLKARFPAGLANPLSRLIARVELAVQDVAAAAIRESC